MPDYYIPLREDLSYHIFSRSVGNEKVFREEKNYRFFLQKYKFHISPIADTYGFCLLQNHFHFMIRIKSKDSIISYYEKSKKGKLFNPENASSFIMQQFSNLLNSYAKSYNKMYYRKGSLFIDYLRRVEIKCDSQFGRTLFYIHKNPVHHQYAATIIDWYWSSYKILLSDTKTDLLRKEVMDFFGGKSEFIKYHQQPIDLKIKLIEE